MEDILKYIDEVNVPPHALDSAIKTTRNLKYLNVLLDGKLKYLKSPGPDNKISFDISHIYIHDTYDIELIKQVLLKVLLVSEDPTNLVLELIHYIKGNCHIFECKLKLLHIFGILVKYCQQEHQLNLLFNELKYDFIINFLLNLAQYKEMNKTVYEVLLYMYPLLPTNEKLNYLNKIFDFCQANTNLDMLCIIFNELPNTLVNEESCFNTDKFWNFLSNCLTGPIISLHKQVVYILMNFISNFNNVSLNKYISTKNDCRDSWNVFFILLDVGREKQLHLVEPAINLFKYVGNLHFIWQKCVYKLYLSHSKNVVVYKTASYLIKQEYQDEDIQCVLKLILPALNTYDYNDSIHQTFLIFREFCLNMNKDNFELLLDELLHVAWNPVSLWKVIQSIFVAENKNPISIEYFQDIISCVANLPHIYIKTECIKFLIDFFWDEKSFFKIYKIALALKKHNVNYEMYFKNYHVSEDIADFIINELLILSDDCDRTDKGEICFLLLGKLNYDIVPTIIGKHIQKLSPHIKIYAWQFFLKTQKTPRDDFYKQIVEFIPEYFVDHLISDSADSFLSLLTVLIEYMDYVPTKIAEIMIDSCLKPNHFKKIQIYVSMSFVNKYFSVLSENFDSYNNQNSTLGKEIVDIWRHEIVSERDTNICIEYINLLFNINKTSFSYNDTLEIVELFKTLFDCHSNKLINHIFGKLITLIQLSEAQELVFEFIHFCHQKIGMLKKTAQFREILINFIKAIHSEVYLRHNIINVFEMHTNMLEYSRVYPIIRLQQILALKNFINNKNILHFGNLIQTVVELYLQGIINSKDERTEYLICQQFVQNSLEPYVCDISELSDQSNPNILNATSRILALETMLDIAKYRSSDLITCLRGEYLKYFKKRYFINSEIHIKKLRISQALILLLPYIKEFSKDAVQIGVFLLDCFLEESNQICVKQLFNWILILLLQGAAFAGIEYIKRVTSMSSNTPTSVFTGLIPTFYHLALFDSEDPIRSFSAVLSFALPWSMGSEFKLRICAQDIIQRLIHEAKENNYQDFLSKYGNLEDSVNNCIKASGPSYERTLKTDLVFLNFCNPISDNSLKTVLIDIPKLNGVYSAEWENIFSCILNLNHSGYIETLSDKSPLEPKDQSFSLAIDNYLKKLSCEKEETCQGDIPNLNIQKKITPWKNVSQEPTTDFNPNFLLVTSLIEKPQNLGGLSRTCEAFGVQNIVFNDVSVMENKEFQSLSMSSEVWIKATKVKQNELRSAILDWQKEGYCVVGAEQTTNSIKLNDYCFPLKTVLLLGNEKTGIPADLIPLLDVCVEIPQFGQTRSLNVHVAGATIIWEYVKQHSLQKMDTTM